MNAGNIIQALNSPIRRDIIKRLKSGPMNAGDLAQPYDVTKSTMSTHFTILKNVGLIEYERDGNTLIYHLNTTVAEEAIIAVSEILLGFSAGRASSIDSATGDKVKNR